MNKVIGKSVIPDVIRQSEIKLIEKEKEQHWKDFFKKAFNDSSQNTFVDVFCKKGKDYYIFDVKHKTFKENKNPNRFYVTDYEVLNYAKIIKENKVKLKILIIVEKGKESFYKIFDWCDFLTPKNYNPHKTGKTSIKLKDGLDISRFKKFSNNFTLKN